MAGPFSAVGPMVLMPLEDDAEVDRVHMHVRLYVGDTVINLANLHLPSDGHRGREGARKQRLLEIDYALGQPSDRPDVELGDFNDQPHGPCLDVLRSRDYVDTAVLCAAGNSGSSIRRVSCLK
jgi:hypothetical protein